MSSTKKISKEEAAAFRTKILLWYGRHRRALPWRALPDESPDPYKVWMSEVMLQQTTVQAVIPYFLKFTEKWPTVHDLADALNDDVMSEWAGLGYYARARNLHKCAKVVSQELNGVFPQSQEALLALPGVGDYTSAAITSIAFNKPATVVDGNVERVMARYHACDVPLPEGKKDLKYYAHLYADGFSNDPGDYAQALMDLGATICTPKSPVCALCPMNDNCTGYAKGIAAEYPKRSPKKTKPKRLGHVYYIIDEAKRVLVQKRPDKGLLGGMWGLPTSEWATLPDTATHHDLLCDADVTSMDMHIEHVFTHFHLRLDLHRVTISSGTLLPDGYQWREPENFAKMKFPTAFKKAVKLLNL